MNTSKSLSIERQPARTLLDANSRIAETTEKDKLKLDTHDTLPNNNVGLVKVRKDTPDFARRSLENFFESKGLFIASIPEGIVVSDTEKAAEEVKTARGSHKYEQ